jgi:endoglucanase
MNFTRRQIALIAAGTLFLGIIIGFFAHSSNPLKKVDLFVDAQSSVQSWINEHQYDDPYRANLFKDVAKEPQALWLTGGQDDIPKVKRVVSLSSIQGATPVIVLYNIPNRDCGQHSAGGTAVANDYRKWVSTIASEIGVHQALIIIEPDALAGMDCLDQSGQEERFALVKYAAQTLAKNKQAYIYIDAGHPDWQKPEVIADRLKKVGISTVRGFALNVSNFHTTGEVIQYGKSITEHLPGVTTYVIDTSRNGNGPAPKNEWCNPPGRSLGARPTTKPNILYVDAFLWVKNIGESDGECNGGPKAGFFWADYVESLIKQTQK